MVKNMVLKLIILLFSIFFYNISFASQLKIYDFTYSFVECVKSNSSQSDNYTRVGKVDSSLMNGEGIIVSSDLNGSYWDYMDCLSPSNSGTQNRNLEEALTCPGVNFNLSDRRFYVPPSVDGKKIGIANRFWLCSGGSWRESDGVIVIPNGQNINTPTPYMSGDCESEIIKSGRCTFELKEAKDGFNSEDQFGSIFGDDWNGYSGNIIANCTNGSFRVMSNTCVIDQCISNEAVEWSNSSGSSGDSLSTCKGNVSYNGDVVTGEQERQYFSSLKEAISLTKVNLGSATFNCREGSWVRPSSALCRTKTSSELNCSSIKGAGDGDLFFCQ